VRSRWPVLLLFCLATVIAGCAQAPPPAPAPSVPPPAPRDEPTAAAIAGVLAGDHRSLEHRSRDEHRHPLETLLFFGIKPDMNVVEAWPGTGWYTDILAPLLGPRGQLTVAHRPPDPRNAYVTATLQQFAARLSSRPDLYGKARLTALGPGHFEAGPPGSADLVVSFDTLHNWMNLGMAPEALAALHRVLKPGGVFGITGYRGDASRPQDARAASGYVSEPHAIALIEAAGFALEARSELNANPRDTKDHEQGVWALPPSYRAGNRDRAKFETIGEPDRFTLKFRKR
jgi:predicted methyltransferase